MKRRTAAAALALAMLRPISVSAQSSTRALAAEELFRDGRALIAKHHYKEACEKLSASQAIERAVGTLVSLGECYSGQGRAASAWLAYRSAIALASERGDPRKAAAEERAAAVEPQLSYLVVHVRAETAVPGTEISIDGETFGRDVLGAPVPVDAGPHAIAATAPGYKTWSAHVQVAPLADNVTVDIPALEPLPDPKVVEHARSVAATKKAAGIAGVAAGLVGLGVGSILGFQAIVKIRDANQACPSAAICGNASAVQENQSGKSLADASSVVVPVSAAFLVAGAFLFFTSHAPRGTEIAADVSPGGARVKVGWSW